MFSRADAVDIDAKYYLSLVGFTVLYYDYALTLGMEISRFWSPLQLSWGTAIFLLSRYVVILGYVPAVLAMFDHHPTEKTCHKLLSYHQYLSVTIQAIVGAIMVTRTYALWGSKRSILMFLLVLMAVVAAFGGWALLAGKSDPALSTLYDGSIGCQLGLSYDQGWHMGAGWAGVVCFDAVIFALTVYKSLRIERMGYRSIVDVLLRDGAVYFAVMGTTTLCNVLTFMLGRPFSRGIVTTMTNIFSSIAATRLMLNLRDPKVWLNRSQSMPTTTGPNIRFKSPATGTESSFLPERTVEDEIVEEPRHNGGFEMLSLGESSRTRDIA